MNGRTLIMTVALIVSVFLLNVACEKEQPATEEPTTESSMEEPSVGPAFDSGKLQSEGEDVGEDEDTGYESEQEEGQEEDMGVEPEEEEPDEGDEPEVDEGEEENTPDESHEDEQA